MAADDNSGSPWMTCSICSPRAFNFKSSSLGILTMSGQGGTSAVDCTCSLTPLSFSQQRPHLEGKSHRVGDDSVTIFNSLCIFLLRVFHREQQLNGSVCLGQPIVKHVEMMHEDVEPFFNHYFVLGSWISVNNWSPVNGGLYIS